MGKNSMDSARIGRLALGAATVIALVAVGVAVTRDRGAEPPASTAAPKPAETPDQAIAKLEARLKANPQDVKGWQLLGWAFFETNRFAEAATAYRRAATLSPGSADLWSSLGEALALSTDKRELPQDATDAFRKAIAIDSKDARARYFLAVGKDVSGDHKGAIDDWFALLADTPAGAPWEADLRRTIEEVAAREKIDVAARLAAVKPAPGAAHPSLPSVATAAIPGPTREQMQAAAALPKGQQDMMVQSMIDGLEAKLKADPSNVQGWMMLMRSRMTLGETAKAGAAWKSAVAANPGAKVQIDQAARTLGIPGG
jgi:cytochrome c-type biogenesis protein CcmH